MGRALVVDSRRLFAAADMLLDAEQPGRGAQLDRAHRHRPARPRSRTFSRTELVEARSLLYRLGFAEPSDRRLELPSA